MSSAGAPSRLGEGAVIGELRESRWVRALLVPLIVLAWLAVLLVGAWLLSHVTRALLMLVLGTLLAFALTPLVNLFARWLPRLLAIAIAYLLGLAIFLALLSLVVVSAATEVTNLAHNLPDYAARVREMEPQMLRLLSPLGVSRTQLTQAEASALSYLQGLSSQVAADALEVVTTVLGTIVDAVLVLILSVYLVANGPRLVRWLREQAPTGQRRRANVMLAIVNQVVGGYIRGTFTLALLVGVLVGAGMGVLRVRYALLLGILAFFMEFIPVLGVFISGTVCVLIALFQGWVLAVVVLGYFVLVHVIEGDLVGPRIMARAVGVHPAVALLALVAGSELFGLWGALFGAPLAGLVQAIVTAAHRELRDQRGREAAEPATGASGDAAPETAATAPAEPEEAAAGREAALPARRAGG